MCSYGPLLPFFRSSISHFHFHTPTDQCGRVGMHLLVGRPCQHHSCNTDLQTDPQTRAKKPCQPDTCTDSAHALGPDGRASGGCGWTSLLVAEALLLSCLSPSFPHPCFNHAHAYPRICPLFSLLSWTLRLMQRVQNSRHKRAATIIAQVGPCPCLRVLMH